MTNVVLTVETNLSPDDSVLVNDTLVPVLTDSGPNNYLCGDCGFVVAEGMHAGKVQNLVIRCPRCKANNRTRT